MEEGTERAVSAPLKPWKSSISGGVRNQYRVRVVSAKGTAIPDAVIQFSAWDPRGHCNDQTVVTDAKGECTLVEEFLAGRDKAYYDWVRKILTLDIPGHAVGPVPFHLRKDAVNVITAKKGAAIHGKVVDWNGDAMWDKVYLEYINESLCTSEFVVGVSPGGDFTIDRIMPGEPFRIHGGGAIGGSTPACGMWSDVMTLKPGEVLRDVVLTVPQPAAVRGIIVDEEGRPVKSVYSVTFRNKFRGWGHGQNEGDYRFGDDDVPPIPLRIKIDARGFQRYVGPEISLKPGELRFVKVVLKKDTTDKPAPPTNR